ncbi:MAG TPA: DUF362 domain-containing protein [Bryobacteraceae bacterium]|nr:DUF362 domain-containing protein [Bryobacteraceae bacterium]
MAKINRREFLAAAAQAASAAALSGSAPGKRRIGLVHSTHARLARPASPEDPLDDGRVRDMVWKAIEYAGGFEDRIRPGSWVVIKPNIVFLRPQSGYTSGDVTDLRVTRAVLEYVARKAPAARVTIAEGGSYRSLRDPAEDNVVSQNSARVDATTFDWGDKEFPGAGGTLNSLLRDMATRFPGKTYDYVDLNYDGVKDASGRLRRVEVPVSRTGVKAFGARPDYFVTNTIRKCDFLITVPVMKVHEQCGITASMKSYVGTAPRLGYAVPGKFWNVNLHEQHSVENRIDPFIIDLASFHPPDFTVVDGIRGLQYTEHNNDRPDQMIRSNLVMASVDPVGADALAAQLMGFNPWDIDFLHLAQMREMGRRDLAEFDILGDDPGKLRRRWAKPRRWYGRNNREWRVTKNPEAPMETWERYTAPTDVLRFARWAPGTSFAAAVRVQAEGHRKAFLWVGARGRFTALLNGARVMEQENLTQFRVGQFQQAVELRPGENLLVFRVQAEAVPAQISALLVGPRNDGDTVEGIRWVA